MEERKELILIDLYLTTPVRSVQLSGLWSEAAQVSGLRKFWKRIEELNERCTEVEFKLQTRTHHFTVPTKDKLVERIKTRLGEQSRMRLARSFMPNIHHFYLEEKNLERAKFYAQTAFAVSGTRAMGSANNIGYLYLTLENFDEAKLWFEAAREFESEEDDKQIISYNLGVLNALIGNLEVARQEFARACSEEDSGAACIYRVSGTDGKVSIEEVFDIDSVGALSREALDQLAKIEGA
jgi:tetratricopeptide (TPR) repeat protein